MWNLSVLESGERFRENSTTSRSSERKESRGAARSQNIQNLNVTDCDSGQTIQYNSLTHAPYSDADKFLESTEADLDYRSFTVDLPLTPSTVKKGFLTFRK